MCWLLCGGFVCLDGYVLNDEGGQALEQPGWRSCGVSVPEGIQNQTGHGTEHPALADAVLSRYLGLGDPQRSLPS